MKFLLSLIIMFSYGICAYCEEEEAATEKDARVWFPEAQMIEKDVKAGKCAASSGLIKGSYPTFTLRISKTDMSRAGARLSFYWKTNSNDPDWTPQVRLCGAPDDGFFYWNMPGGRRSGNRAWQRVDFRIGDMKRYQKADLHNIDRIIFVGDHIINSNGAIRQTEFFIDGLRFEVNGKRQVLQANSSGSLYGVMHSDVPADVKHPALMFKAADITRARENVRRHAWADKLLGSLRKQAEFWINCPDDKIAFWIPDESCFICYCPNCQLNSTLKPNADFSGLVCSGCGCKFPSQKYPENKFYVITTPTGKKKKIYYYEGPDQFIHTENIGNKYHISMMLNIHKLQKLYYQILPVAYVYALEGDIKYAEKVRKILLRFADVYPDYVPKWRATAYSSYGRHLMAGKIHGWKIHDSGYVARLAQAYDLTYNSGLYSSEDKVKIENGIFREYKKLMCSTYPPLTDWTINGNPAHYSAAVFCALLLGDHDFLELALDSSHGLKWFVRKYFERDGAFGGSPAYNNMAVLPFARIVDALQGYSDPPSYKGKDPYRNLNIFDTLPELKILYKSLAYMIMPNGYLLPFGDSDMGILYRLTDAETNYKWAPTEENRRLLNAISGDNKLFSIYTLFYRDPNFALDKQEKLPWFMTSSLLLPGRQCAILRDAGSSRPQTALAVYYAGRLDHGHNDTLNFVYYSFGRELATDLGYLSWPHRFTPWLQSILAHNLVVVDGKVQSNSRQGKLNFFSGNFPAKTVSAEATDIYPGVSRYRRSMFMMNRPAGQSYVVDLFSVKGGKEHSYVFHADGEKFIPPEIPFKKTGGGEIGGAALGTKYLSDVQLGKVDKDLSCSWISDNGKEKLTTTLHLFNNQPAEFIYMRAPGLRNRNTPLADIKLFPVILRRKGPDNNFIAVIEAFKDKPFIDKIKKLDAGNKDIAALEVISGKYKDIIVINGGDRDEEIKLAKYPMFKFRGKVGAVSLKDGKLDAMYMVGGSQLAWGGEYLLGVPKIKGKVESFDQKSFTVGTSVSSMPKFNCKGEYMIFNSRLDGAYRIEKISGNGTITLNNDEVFRFKKGDEFIIIPGYYKKIK